MDVTKIARMYMRRRVRKASQWAYNTESVQIDQLKTLINIGKRSRWGSQHILNSVYGYGDFVRQMPVNDYESVREHVMSMISGRGNVLWPGVVTRFAQSSGTTGGKSKYIPVTSDSLRLNHYPGASAAVAFYLDRYTDSHLFAGKSLILGGSYANELSLGNGVQVGDLSAHLIDNIPKMAARFRVPSVDIALMSDWSQKLPALIKAAAAEDVTNISGVPSWMLTVLKGVLEYTGAQHIHQVWPNLEVFFHGGIAFGPYREEYNRIIDPDRMRYMETYNASEGFFAVQDDPADPAMLLLMDVGIFYEFVPIDRMDEPEDYTLPAWGVEPGRTYVMLISAPNGLWRYNIGDTVRVESINPLKIRIVGRTKSFINVFGEEVMVFNTDAALANACRDCNCTVVDYTVGPVYAGPANRGRHEWWVEWGTPPADVRRFEAALDYYLQCENSDYQAKRAGGIFLDPLSVNTAPPGLFNSWLARTGNLGGQRKMPRLSNDRRVLDDLHRLMSC